MRYSIAAQIFLLHFVPYFWPVPIQIYCRKNCRISNCILANICHVPAQLLFWTLCLSCFLYGPDVSCFVAKRCKITIRFPNATVVKPIETFSNHFRNLFKFCYHKLYIYGLQTGKCCWNQIKCTSLWWDHSL